MRRRSNVGAMWRVLRNASAVSGIVLLGAACASGGLTQADKGRIEAATKNAEPKYLACYAEALTTAPTLTGKVVLAFDVTTNSTAVRNARVSSTDIHSEGFEACVLKTTSEIAIASLPEGPAAITYPVEFSREPPDPVPPQ